MILSTLRPAFCGDITNGSDDRACPSTDARRSTPPPSSYPPASAPLKPPSLNPPLGRVSRSASCQRPSFNSVAMMSSASASAVVSDEVKTNETCRFENTKGGSALPPSSSRGLPGSAFCSFAERPERPERETWWNNQPTFKNPSKRWWRRRELKPGWAFRVSARRCDKKPVFIGRNALSEPWDQSSEIASKRTKTQKFCHQLSSMKPTPTVGF